MATVPSFIYLSKPQKTVISPRRALHEEMLSKMNPEEEDTLATCTPEGLVQPGVWWKDDAKWVMYDDKTAEQILTAEEFGVLKVKFNRSTAAHPNSSASSTATHRSSSFGNSPPNSMLLDMNKFKFKRRSISRLASSDSSSSSSSIETSEYEVDLTRMKEVHSESGRYQERDIKIVKPRLKEYNFLTISSSTDSSAMFSINIKNFTGTTHVRHKMKEGAQRYTVRWLDETGRWCSYRDDHQTAIWSAWTRGDLSASIDNVRSQRYPSGMQYIADLKAMQQRNVITGSQRPLQIAVWICSSTSQLPHLSIEKDFKYLTKELRDPGMMENEIILHKLALGRLVCPEYIKQAISGSIGPHTLQSMEMNAHLLLPKNELWDRFLHSFMRTVRAIPDYIDHLWKFALNPHGPHHPANPFAPNNSNSLWRFVFHAVSHRHDARLLLNSGVRKHSSTRYDTDADWFGLTGTITELHCKPVSRGVVSMLVFLVMMPQEFDESREKVVFIRKTKDHLPVASITVSIDDSTLGPACSLWEDMNEDESPRAPSSSWEAETGSRSAANYSQWETGCTER